MNVVFLVARGWHAGYLGCHGNPWIETPALDALAAESVVFDQHFAATADPGGARRAWRTGCHLLPMREPAPEPPRPDLLAALRQHGVSTILLEDAGHPSPWGDAPGWDVVERAAADEERTSLEATLEKALDLLDALKDSPRPWLLWVELAPLLPPWDVPEDFLEPYFAAEPEETREEDEEEEEEPEEEEPEEEEPGEQAVEYEEVEEEELEDEGPEEALLEDEEAEEEALPPLTDLPPGPIGPDDDQVFLQVQNSYAGAVSYLDAAIGRLVEVLGEEGMLEDTVVIVTTDHGQALGEHGLVGSGHATAHEEVMHLPLIVRLPGAAESARRVMGLTQSIDLAPTLAELFGASLPQAHGQSLLPLLHGKTEELRPYLCAGAAREGAVEWLLRTPDWAFLLPGRSDPEDPRHRPRLYVKPDDRWEVNDVLQHHLEFAEALEKTLAAFLKAAREPGPLVPPPLPEGGDVEAAHEKEGTE